MGLAFVATVMWEEWEEQAEPGAVGPGSAAAAVGLALQGFDIGSQRCLAAPRSAIYSWPSRRE